MAYELILNGRVQGVGCRHYCSLVARSLGLRGAATNLDDGSVQVLISSNDRQKIDQLAHALQFNKAGYNFWGEIDSIAISEYLFNIDGDYCW